MALDKAFKRKWIAALRGGNFKQGQHSLRNHYNECCCLGVAADLLGAKWRGSSSLGWACSMQQAGTAYLNARTLKHIGLTAAQQLTLVAMNDRHDAPRTFAEIADYIEKHL